MGHNLLSLFVFLQIGPDLAIGSFIQLVPVSFSNHTAVIRSEDTLNGVADSFVLSGRNTESKKKKKGFDTSSLVHDG